jgi:hypothetical protein
MSPVALLKRVKVHDVKLANVKRLIVLFRVRFPIFEKFGRSRFFEEILPPSLKDAYTRSVIPTVTLHPAERSRMTLDDDMLCRVGILKICINLY